MGAYIQQASCDYLAFKLFYNEVGATDFTFNDSDIVILSIEQKDDQTHYSEIDIDLNKRTIKSFLFSKSEKSSEWGQKIDHIIQDYEKCNDLFDSLWRIYYNIDSYKAKNYSEILNNFRVNGLTFKDNVICLVESLNFISFAKTLKEAKLNDEKLNNHLVIKDGELYTQIKNELLHYDSDSSTFNTFSVNFRNTLSLMFNLKKSFNGKPSTLTSRAFEKICRSYNIHFIII